MAGDLSLPPLATFLNRLAEMIQRAKQTRSDNVRAFVLATAMVAVALVGIVRWVDHTTWTGPVNWPAIAVMTAMYLFGEVHSVAWLSRREGGVVTPGWAFCSWVCPRSPF